MNLRALDLLALPLLYTYRNQAVFLDSDRLLADGNPLSARSFLSHRPSGDNVFTAISDELPPLVGGIRPCTRPYFASLQYLAPKEHLQKDKAVELIEFLLGQAREWRRPYVRASVPENEAAIDWLRDSGFMPWAWQQHYICIDKFNASHAHWRPARPDEWTAISQLHRQIVPAQLRWLDAPAAEAPGWVYHAHGRLAGFALCQQGTAGRLVTPLLPPSIAAPRRVMEALLAALSRPGKPLYVRIRSYQSHLLPVMDDLLPPYGKREFVFLKKMGAVLPAEESRRIEERHGITAPLTSCQTRD